MERSVAILDDDRSGRRSTCRLIGSLGHRTRAFISTEELLDAGRPAETASLIVDVRMPSLDELALQHVRATQGLRVPIAGRGGGHHDG